MNRAQKDKTIKATSAEQNIRSVDVASKNINNGKIFVSSVKSLEKDIKISDVNASLIIEKLLPHLERTVNFIIVLMVISLIIDTYLIINFNEKSYVRIIDRNVVIAFIAASAAKISVIIIAALAKIGR
jgi:hypothetical protein